MPVIQTSTLYDLLTPCYGSSASRQQERYEKALRRFYELYGAGPVQLFRAPGRVNLIGEHTDYNHGFVLPAALDKDVILIARSRGDSTIRAANIESAYATTEFELNAVIPPAPRGDWSNYLRGPAQTLASRYELPGMDLLFIGEPPDGVPRSVGLSSSSALVVAMAVALAHQAGVAYNTPTFAQGCADAEWYVGTRGGIMDHFASLLTQRDHALFLDCRPLPDGGYLTRHIPFSTSHRLLVIDSGVRHDNIRGEFNRRVAACRAGVAALRAQYPGTSHLRDLQKIPWTSLAPLLPTIATARQLAAEGVDLGDIPGLDPDATLNVLGCCRHVWHENARVLQTLDALASQDIAQVGALLTAAHISARDDYEISTPELDFLVNRANAFPGVAGARLTGAGWGGCVLVLVEAGVIDPLSVEIAGAYQNTFGMTPGIFLCQAAPGASYLGALTL